MINLLPQEYIRVQKNKTNRLVGIGVITLELSLAILLAVQPLGEWNAKNTELQAVKERIESVQFEEVRSVQGELELTLDDYHRWTAQIESVSGSQFISGIRLDTLVSNVPVGVTIDVLDLDEPAAKIEIQGKATNTFSLTGYVSKLQTLYPETTLDFDMEEITMDKPYTSFRITIEWEGTKDE